MTNMTDRTWAATLINFSLSSNAAPTKPTQPLHLRLMTAQGSNTSNGTEATAGNCPGYTALGVTMGNPSFGANSSGVSSSSNAQSWTATGAWATIVAGEVWDTAGSPIRLLQGALSTSISGIANGDVVSFAVAAVTADITAW